MKILHVWKCENDNFLKQNNKNTETAATDAAATTAAAATVT